jgi:hypothetical protein
MQRWLIDPHYRHLERAGDARLAGSDPILLSGPIGDRGLIELKEVDVDQAMQNVNPIRQWSAIH